MNPEPLKGKRFDAMLGLDVAGNTWHINTCPSPTGENVHTKDVASAVAWLKAKLRKEAILHEQAEKILFGMIDEAFPDVACPHTNRKETEVNGTVVKTVCINCDADLGQTKEGSS